MITKNNFLQIPFLSLLSLSLSLSRYFALFSVDSWFIIIMRMGVELGMEADMRAILLILILISIMFNE